MANLGGWRGTSIGQITRHSPSAPASGTYTYLFQDMTIDGWRIAVSRALVNKHVTPYDDWRLAHGRVTPRTCWQSLHHQQNIKKYLYCTYSYHSYKLKYRRYHGNIANQNVLSTMLKGKRTAGKVRHSLFRQ